MPTDSVDVKELLEIQEKSFRAAVQLLVDKQMQESKLLRQEISDLRMSLTYSQREIDDLKVKCDKLEKDNVRNQANFEDTHAAIVDLEDQSDYLENQSRRNTVKISGIPEKENGFETWEETEQLVKEAIKDKLKITADIQIERAHRIGQRGGGRRAEGRGRRQMFSNNRKENEPRTIVAKCLSWKHKSEVIQAARKLKPDGVMFLQDFSARTLDRRAAQVPDLMAARRRGKIAYLVVDKLVIKEKKSFGKGGGEPSSNHSPSSQANNTVDSEISFSTE